MAVRGTPLEERFKGAGDGGVAALGGVLISLRRGRAGVSEAGHQFAGRGSGLYREGASGVAEVM